MRRRRKMEARSSPEYDYCAQALARSSRHVASLIFNAAGEKGKEGRTIAFAIPSDLKILARPWIAPPRPRLRVLTTAREQRFQGHDGRH